MQMQGRLEEIPDTTTRLSKRSLRLLRYRGTPAETCCVLSSRNCGPVSLDLLLSQRKSSQLTGVPLVKVKGLHPAVYFRYHSNSRRHYISGGRAK